MKKTRLYFTLVFIAMAFVSIVACKKEKLVSVADEQFKIEIPLTAPTIAYPGGEVAFDVQITAPDGIQKVELRRDFQLVEGSMQSFESNPETGIYHFSFTADKFDIGKKFNFVIAAYDKNGFTSTLNYTISIEQKPVNISITIPTTAPETVLLSEIAGFTVPVISELPLKSIKTFLGGVAIEGLTQTDFANSLKADYNFQYETTDDDAGQSLTFTIVATDIEDKEKSAEYVLKVDGTRPPKPVNAFDITFGGQLNTDVGHFLKTSTGTVYSRAGIASISAQIDLLGFVSGSSSGVNITAPSFKNAELIYTAANSGDDALVSWPVRNDTQLIRLTGIITAARFETILIDTEIATMFNEGGTPTDNINRIVANDVIAFKTAKGKFGIMLIKTTPANNKGVITFSLKMQK